jgi:hypothetical protein
MTVKILALGPPISGGDIAPAAERAERFVKSAMEVVSFDQTGKNAL